MPVFVLDVLADRLAQPFQAHWQACAAGHHQRYGVPHVVVSLGQERLVACQADLAIERIANDWQVEQRLTLVVGGLLQGVEKTHDVLSSSRKVSVSCAR
ncbi:hypothetical protein D3C79_870400 [compost metagenome]